MQELVIFLGGVMLGVVLTIVVLWDKARQVAKGQYQLYSDYLARARAKKQALRRAKKQEVVKAIGWHGQLTAVEVSEKLGFSQSAVKKYLDELVEDKKVEQRGEFGKGVYYLKIKK